MSLGAALFSAAAFLLPAAAVHLAVCRFTGGRRFMLKSLLIGALFVAAAAVWSVKGGKPCLVLLYLVFTGWLAYIMFFINLINSITLKMLQMLAESPGESLPGDRFQEAFGTDKGIGARLEDMRANAFILQDGEALRPGAGAKLLLLIVLLIRKIFSIDATG